MKINPACPAIVSKFVLCAAIIVFSATAFAQNTKDAQDAQGMLKAEVNIEPGAQGVSGVKFLLYRLPLEECCPPCKVPPKRRCSECCTIGSELIESTTLIRSGVLQFKNLEAGKYLLVNDVDGRFAGLETLIEVKKSGKTDLGHVAIDLGKPMQMQNNRMHHETRPRNK